MRQTMLLSTMVLGLAACGERPPENLCDTATDCYVGPANTIITVDGDTYEFRGQRLRLIGWDSPESAPHAKCDAEAELGAEAERRAWALFSQANQVQIKPVRRDEYGRIEAHIYLDRVDVGFLLEKEGLAAAWDDPTVPRPDWCNAS